MPIASPLPIGEIDALFNAWDRPDSPGCALGVVRRGDPIYARGYGAANLEYDVPIAPSSVFHVASVSKQFTALAIVLLAKEGKLGIDDDIRAHLPELPDFDAPITIRQLLNHTGGLRDQWDLLALAGWRPDDLKTNGDVLDLAVRQRDLNFPPGAEWVYCNTGYTLTGIVAERASGRSLRAFLHERIFGPLGMARTHFHDDHAEIVPGRAYGYESRDGGGYKISIPPFDTVGATSLFTTVEDLARWVGWLEAERSGDGETLAALLTPGVLNSGETIDYALGLRVGEYRGTRIVEHSGADAGYRAHFLWFPDEGLGIAILCNLSTMLPGQLARQVADRCLGLVPEPEPAETAPAPGELACHAGIYRQPSSGLVARVHLDGDRLRVGALPLTPLADGSFRGLATRYRFTEDSAGGRELRERDPNGKETVYAGVPAAAPAPGDLAAYEGTYRSPELDVTYTIARRDDRLVLRRRKFDDRPLHPTIADAFTDDRVHLAFARDERGRVDGFGLTTGRVRNLRFDRR